MAEIDERPAAAAPFEPVVVAAPVQSDRLAAARTLADHGDLASARTLCEAAADASSLDIEAQILLAAICLESDDASGAIAAARRATYLDRGSAAAHFILGSAQARLGATGETRRAMKTVLDLLADDDEARPLSQHLDFTVGGLRQLAARHLALDARKTLARAG